MTAERPKPRVRVVSVDHIPPRQRQRPEESTQDYAALYTPASPRPTVFVHRAVFEDLAEDGEDSLPDETIGLLYGRSWQDADGPWLLINRYVVAAPDEKECSPGQSSLTAAGNSKLRRRTELLFPAEECLGWAHTHTAAEPEFSPGDRDQQRRKSTESVGLLAHYHADDGGWRYTGYLGPDIQRLTGDVLTRPDTPARSLPGPRDADRERAPARPILVVGAGQRDVPARSGAQQPAPGPTAQQPASGPTAQQPAPGAGRAVGSAVAATLTSVGAAGVVGTAVVALAVLVWVLWARMWERPVEVIAALALVPLTFALVIVMNGLAAVTGRPDAGVRSVRPVRRGLHGGPTTIRGRWSHPVIVVCGVVLLLFLLLAAMYWFALRTPAGHSDDGDGRVPGAAGATTGPASPSAPPAMTAEVQAAAADATAVYTGFLGLWAAGGTYGPELSRYTTGSLFTALRAEPAGTVQGAAGKPSSHPRVDEVRLDARPPTVRISDCPGGTGAITCLLVFDLGRGWLVDVVTAHRDQVCA